MEKVSLVKQHLPMLLRTSGPVSHPGKHNRTVHLHVFHPSKGLMPLNGPKVAGFMCIFLEMYFSVYQQQAGV